MKDQEIELSVLESIEKISSQRDLASEVGHSLGKVNHVLKSLIEKGFIKVENFAKSEKKSQYKYLLTEKGIKEKISLTEEFIKIKKVEYDKLQEKLEKYNEQYSSVLNVGSDIK